MFNFLALLDIISLITIVASDWPRTFFTARLFLFSICTYIASDSNYIPFSLYIDNNTGVMGDPHFMVPLLSGNILCYSIQGYPGLAFNLIYTEGYVINALFIDTSEGNEATWIGKLAVIPRHANKSEVVIFDSVKQEVVLVDQGQFKASVVDKISYDENGKMSVKFTPGIAKQAGNPTVHVKYGKPLAKL